MMNDVEQCIIHGEFGAELNQQKVSTPLMCHLSPSAEALL